ncbi:MAG: sucrase ferredoxin [Marmoricola sp.]
MTATRCSAASAEALESTVGTAATGTAWVCLEQLGAWGPKAFTSSHLDPRIGKEFEDAASAANVRPQLIRAPGRHPDAGSGLRHVLIAYTGPGASWLLEGKVDDPERVLDLDFAAIAAGIRPTWPELTPVDAPVLLVCTHARRDVCCATLGRGVAARVADSHPGRVWEASHLSGHRFAATTALLPSGHMHGRVLDASLILDAADRGELLATGWRGRSTWSHLGQAAEAAIRERENLWGIDAINVAPHDSRWLVSAGSASWTVKVAEHHDGMAPPSCGKAPEPVRRYTTSVQ